MYESNYNSNPQMILNPFTDSVESIAIFKSHKEFLDSLTKAVVDCGGSPEMFVRPDITLTQLMNSLAINGVRFMFDVSTKKGSNSEIDNSIPSAPSTPENTEDVVQTLPTETVENLSE